MTSGIIKSVRIFKPVTESFLGGIRVTLAGTLDRNFGEYLNATQYANDVLDARSDLRLGFIARHAPGLGD